MPQPRPRIPIFCGTPTGRAAKRLAETTGVEARTIHRLLEVQPGGNRFARHEGHPLECDLLIVDDDPFIASMLSDALEKVSKNAAAIKKSLQEVTEEKCELCGKPLIIKWGRNGSFIACTGYPECTNTRQPQTDESGADSMTEQDEAEYCDNCGRPMVLKKGRFGTFFACTGYPDCKTTKQIGAAQKKSVVLDEKCPQCSWPILMLKTTKSKGEEKVCPQKECGYTAAQSES